MSGRWHQWYKQKGWKPFAFQKETWAAWLAGESGLIHAPTGLGKTLAAWGGPLLEWLEVHPAGHPFPQKIEPLRVLWLTPLRALANDTAESLLTPVKDLGLPWTVGLRTGDTASAVRQKQRTRFPTALITTPESLSLLLTHAETREKFATLRGVIVDEWHELLGSKRGIQTELCLARLRRWFPSLRIWGVSATLGNLDKAFTVLLGKPAAAGRARLVSAPSRKRFVLKTLIPARIESFPAAGHSGLHLLAAVIRQIEQRRTTLLFTNTRSQTEIWFQALTAARPDWREGLALHHGSLDRDVRHGVETKLREGSVKCVVCTSSLDLGVDFSPVEQVIQVGGPKGIARMLQRAGRSGHQPGAVSRIVGVPAHALELVEFAAVREAIARGELESREPPECPLDVLVQHVVTLAMGGGFQSDEALSEIRSAWSYRHLSDDDWEWVLEFVTRGGRSLRAYPQFQRVQNDDGAFTATRPLITRLHRLSVGTITSDASMNVQWVKGGLLGTIEEGFIARLRNGDGFSFAGHKLELVRVREMTAYVRKAKKPARLIPQWLGGKMPLSSQLAHAVRRLLAGARRGEFHGAEMKAAKPVLELQARWSVIPDPDELLVECAESRDGWHYFLYPFAGRLAHEGLAALAAYRLGRNESRSFALTMNDYGFALTTTGPLGLDAAGWRTVLSPDRLLDDLQECLNATELAKRQFREIARIAGLVFHGYPGAGKSARQLQASSGLFFDVFSKYDPGNRLLDQARREVAERQLEVRRLHDAMVRIQSMQMVIRKLDHLTPLAFPLWAMWIQAEVSTERWSERINRMVAELAAAAKECQ